MGNISKNIYQMLYNHRKLLGATAIIGATILTINYCSQKPIVYSPHIYNKKGHEMSIKKPFIPGEYSAIPGAGEHVYKVTVDLKGDGKLPTDKTLTFIVKGGQILELDTIGYTKKGERVASEKIILHGKKIKKPKIEKPKIIAPPKEIEKPKLEPKISEPPEIHEEPALELPPQIPEEPKPNPFDLGQDNGTVYKVQLPGKDGWFLNFCSTLAHSKDGKEGVVEFMYPIGKEKGEKVESSCLIAADVPTQLLWDHKKPNVRLNTLSEVNKFVKNLLDKGYVIKGKNKDGLFLFDGKTAEEYNVKVKLNQHKGGLQKRLCDIVTWEEDLMQNGGGSSSSSGPSGESSGGGVGGGGEM